MTYSVVGLGKLGCSMAAAIASRGHRVIGYDVQRDVVAALAAGRAPVAEPGLDALIRDHAQRLHATDDLSEAVQGSDVTFVVVPTPSDERGAFVLRYAIDAFSRIGESLASKRTPHTVVLTSTVLPGSTRFALIPALERAAGRAIGSDIGVCYSPAFIALGSVVRDFLNPDFVLLGESDAAAGDRVERAYAEILPGTPPVRRMTLENAELTKLAVNTYVTTKISFANMLATLCESIPGGDVDVVSAALGSDRRIGSAYLKGALGYGGPCFPRDNQALSFLADALDADAVIAEATDSLNRGLPARIVAKICESIDPQDTVGVLGLAYKPDTAVVEESQSVAIARALAARGVRVLAHDPLAGATAGPLLGGGVDVVEDVHALLRAADTVLITTPDRAYAGLRAEDFAAGGRRVRVIDFWRVLRSELEPSDLVEYTAIGLGPDNDERRERLRTLWSGLDVPAAQPPRPAMASGARDTAAPVAGGRDSR